VNYLFILIPLVIFILVFLVLFYLKKRKKKGVDLFNAQDRGEGFFEDAGFLKGVLESLISGEVKPHIDLPKDNLETMNASLGEEVGVSYIKTHPEQTTVAKAEKEERIKTSRKKLEEALKKEKIPSSTKKAQTTKKISRTSSGETGGSYGGGKVIEAKKYIDPNIVLKELKNTDLGLILDSLKKEQFSFLINKLMKLNFASKSEFIKSLNEDLVNLLLEANNELKERLSSLRKKGKNVKSIDLRIMTVPLKVKIFSATYSKKDFDKVIEIMKGIDAELKSVEEKIESIQKKDEKVKANKD